jgi:3-phosphoshikimate 1-carboxyvinyltransferase
LGVKCRILKSEGGSSHTAFEVLPTAFSEQSWPNRSIKVSPDQDHRLAMAAAVLRLSGAPLEILNPECVKKSFPNFWEVFP